MSLLLIKQINMKKISTFLAFMIVFSFLNFSQELEKQKPTLGIQVGSMGAGLQFTYPFAKRWDARIAASYMSLNLNSSSKDKTIATEKKTGVTMGGVSLIADFTLSSKTPNWKLAMGVVYPLNKIEETRSYTYIADGFNEDLGSLTLAFTPIPINPYLGFVFGNFKSTKRVGFALELGTLYHGKPSVSFTGTGRIEPTSEQDEVVANNVKNYNFYPYANFQLIFKLSK